MNRTELRPYAPAELEAMEARLALRMTARLTERAAALPQDVSERLRFAREQALQRAQAARAASSATTSASAAVDNGGSTLTLGNPQDGRPGWWVQIAAWMPLLVLVGGLVLIQRIHTQNQIAAAAEIDASILADDLPPAAYSDPGFVEFLKTPRD
ncbi:DUF3619 family protein [Piscinibacter sp. HJYY11]|uniref:DUF3619 family protein n=1 Tax=Piscinibacter sp. HJYY11 TaxID=2801333 RepID=UPI00191F28D1|nr:DUF3619 family protein [Piscinibacter sp. HJYY11]MBL0726825.1 DUF3619 family protein [Piscinibacter sp. HJYY11]